MDYLKIK